MPDLEIFSVTVGKGTLAIAPLPGVRGDYDGDLDLLRQWKPTLVISMTTKVELTDVGADALAADIQQSGCKWIHFPIEDFGAPDEGGLEKWPDIATAAHSVLEGGGRVLAHCRGGCGRSGMVALRLMVEAGENPDRALTRLRKTRPCAVETNDQLQWSLAGSGTNTYI